MSYHYDREHQLHGVKAHQFVAILSLFLIAGCNNCGRGLGRRHNYEVAPWPTLGASPQRTWRSPYLGPQNGSVVAFVPLATAAELDIQMQPLLVDSIGRIFAVADFGPNESSFHSYFPGEQSFELWAGVALGGYADPTLGTEDAVYVGISGGTQPDGPWEEAAVILTAFTANGNAQWTFSQERPSSTAWQVQTMVDSGGRLTATISDGVQLKLLSLNTNGELQWSLPIEGTELAAHVRTEDGTVYVITDGYGLLVTLTAVLPSGERRWEVPLGTTSGFTTVALAALDEGPIIRLNDSIVAVDTDGNERFRYNFDQQQLPIFSQADLALDSDGSVLFAVNFPPAPGQEISSLLHKLDPNGEIQWTAEIAEIIEGGPTLGADGVVYLTSCETLYAYRTDGIRLFTSTLPHRTAGCPVRTEDNEIRPHLMRPILDAIGNLYIGTQHGGVVVVSDD